jgi:cell division protein FtsB
MAKNEAFLKKITANYDNLKDIETKYEKTEGNLAKISKKNEELVAEIERLQEMIRVSDKMIYHPIKDDPIDRKLGEYINSAPMRIRL